MEPGCDYRGLDSWSSYVANCRDADLYLKSSSNLGGQIQVENDSPVVLDRCLMKCSNEPSRTLAVTLQEQIWAVPSEHVLQIFMNYGHVEAFHITGQFPFQSIVQYSSIENAIVARNCCDGLYLDEYCYLVVKFCSEEAKNPLLLNQLEELRDGFRNLSAKLKDIQSEVSTIVSDYRKEISSYSCSLLMKDRERVELADENSDEEVGSEKHDLHLQETWGNCEFDGLIRPQLTSKVDDECVNWSPFLTVVNHFDAHKAVEITSKEPVKYSVVDVNGVIVMPPICLLKGQGQCYAEDAITECYVILGNDSFAGGRDQKLANSDDGFKVCDGALTCIKFKHQVQSSTLGHSTTAAYFAHLEVFLNDHTPDMFIPKEVGYPPPACWFVSLLDLILEDNDILMGREVQQKKIHDTLKVKPVALRFNSLKEISNFSVSSPKPFEMLVYGTLRNDMVQLGRLNGKRNFMSFEEDEDALIMFMNYHLRKGSCWSLPDLSIQEGTLLYQMKEQNQLSVLFQFYLVCFESLAWEIAYQLVAQSKMINEKDFVELNILGIKLRMTSALDYFDILGVNFKDRQTYMPVNDEVGYPPPGLCTSSHLKVLTMNVGILSKWPDLVKVSQTAAATGATIGVNFYKKRYDLVIEFSYRHGLRDSNDSLTRELYYGQWSDGEIEATLQFEERNSSGVLDNQAEKWLGTKNSIMGCNYFSSNGYVENDHGWFHGRVSLRSTNTGTCTQVMGKGADAKLLHEIKLSHSLSIQEQDHIEDSLPSFALTLLTDLVKTEARETEWLRISKEIDVAKSTILITHHDVGWEQAQGHRGDDTNAAKKHKLHIWLWFKINQFFKLIDFSSHKCTEDVYISLFSPAEVPGSHKKQWWEIQWHFDLWLLQTIHRLVGLTYHHLKHRDSVLKLVPEASLIRSLRTRIFSRGGYCYDPNLSRD